MYRSSLFRLWLAGMVGLVIAPLTVTSATAGEGDSHAFRVLLESQMTMKFEASEQKITATTEFDYTWAGSAKQKTVTIDLMSVRANKDDEQLMDTSLTHEKVVNRKDGKTTEVAYDDAPESVRTMLDDSFDTPLCRVHFDEDGREVNREMLARPGAKPLLENGIVANTILFHAPFPRQESTWKAFREVSMGSGRFARGELTYRKVAGARAGQQRVEVTGTLTNEGFREPTTNVKTHDVRYQVSGNQTFDLKQNEWSVGKMKIDVFFKMSRDDKPFCDSTGTLNADFKLVKTMD